MSGKLIPIDDDGLAGHGRRPLAECVTGSGPGTSSQEADRGGSSHRHLGPLTELSPSQVLHAIPGEGKRKMYSDEYECKWNSNIKGL